MVILYALCIPIDLLLFFFEQLNNIAPNQCSRPRYSTITECTVKKMQDDRLLSERYDELVNEEATASSVSLWYPQLAAQKRRVNNRDEQPAPPRSRVS
jgi:hypothetical protein